MNSRLRLQVQRQPDDTTCGPTCLHALYSYYGESSPLEQVISEVKRLDQGGTYAVLLGVHALGKGYTVDAYTWNLQVFDPTWFQLGAADMRDRLAKRRAVISDPKLITATDAYLDFMDAGGEVHFEDLTAGVIRKFLTRGVPIITGLSSTYLYRAMREVPVARPGEAVETMEDDDVRGDPQGHFVVLVDYDKEDRTVLVADPLHPNPAFQGLTYVVEIDRLVCAILLGILTHDADMLIIRPRKDDDEHHHHGNGHDAGREAPPWRS